MRLALFEPDIPQNVGSIIRLGACMGVPVDVIEPCGFPFTDKGLKRAGMDYMALAEIQRHICWDEFHCVQQAASRRIVLLTTKAGTAMNHFKFKADDVLMVGRESSGVPDAVYEAVDGCLTRPNFVRLMPLAP